MFVIKHKKGITHKIDWTDNDSDIGAISEMGKPWPANVFNPSCGSRELTNLQQAFGQIENWQTSKS
uniref:Uncharacterized protein n=1 Tax=Timema genevievae TaxID=629358 RepID=A0A7R9PKT5_TIMGE|nr:unnamed protein product [Timema genevievae]